MNKFWCEYPKSTFLIILIVVLVIVWLLWFLIGNSPGFGFDKSGTMWTFAGVGSIFAAFIVGLVLTTWIYQDCASSQFDQLTKDETS